MTGDGNDGVRETGWHRHEREQLRQGLRATPAQRLAWLEEMMDLALRYQRCSPQSLAAGQVVEQPKLRRRGNE
jgi:hypothetical protein